jgi:hypothetical protein
VSNPDPEFPPPPREIVEAFTAIGGKFTPESPFEYAEFDWPDTPDGPLWISCVRIYRGDELRVCWPERGLLREFPLTEWHLAALLVMSILQGENHETDNPPPA